VKGEVKRFWDVFFFVSFKVCRGGEGEVRNTQSKPLGSFVVFVNTTKLPQVHPILIGTLSILKSIILYLSIFILLINCAH
jgi:hypothetical protein